MSSEIQEGKGKGDWKAPKKSGSEGRMVIEDRPTAEQSAKAERIHALARERKANAAPVEGNEAEYPAGANIMFLEGQDTAEEAREASTRAEAEAEAAALDNLVDIARSAENVQVGEQPKAEKPMTPPQAVEYRKELLRKAKEEAEKLYGKTEQRSTGTE